VLVSTISPSKISVPMVMISAEGIINLSLLPGPSPKKEGRLPLSLWERG